MRCGFVGLSRPVGQYRVPGGTARGRISLLVVHRRCHSAPAPGFRDSGGRGTDAAGKLWLLGSAGYAWSSSVTGPDAYRLDFYYLGIIPHSSYTRAIGFPLRCLQE